MSMACTQLGAALQSKLGQVQKGGWPGEQPHLNAGSVVRGDTDWEILRGEDMLYSDPCHFALIHFSNWAGMVIIRRDIHIRWLSVIYLHAVLGVAWTPVFSTGRKPRSGGMRWSCTRFGPKHGSFPKAADESAHVQTLPEYLLLRLMPLITGMISALQESFPDLVPQRAQP